MQLKKSFFCFNQLLVIIFSLSSIALNLNGNAINECLKKNSTCKNPYEELLHKGIDIDQDIMQLSKLQLHKKKISNNLKGIFIDSKKNLFYIKQSNPVTELMGSRLMNLMLGTKCTPIVKLINDQKFTVASLEVPNFKTRKETDLNNKTILGEVELAIAMDLIGLVDRHSRNMGYIILNSNTLISARVDCDACFDFESNLLGEHSLDTNYLSLKHLYASIKKYPKQDVLNALKKITSIDDKKIVMSIFQSWATLTRAGYNLKREDCLDIAYKLVERKRAFKKEFNLLRKNYKRKNKKN